MMNKSQTRGNASVPPLAEHDAEGTAEVERP
jgi:hypothetical protein